MPPFAVVPARERAHDLPAPRKKRTCIGVIIIAREPETVNHIFSKKSYSFRGDYGIIPDETAKWQAEAGRRMEE